MEAANPRHEHEWEVWETTKLPDGKILIPGVIAHTTSHVEHPELVSQRLVNYARIIGKENIIASVDCGFAQGAFTQRVHPSIMWAKLQALWTATVRMRFNTTTCRRYTSLPWFRQALSIATDVLF